MSATIIFTISGIINGTTHPAIDAPSPKFIGLNNQNQTVPNAKQTISPTIIPVPRSSALFFVSLPEARFLKMPIIIVVKINPTIYPPVIPVSVFGINLTIPLENAENTGTPIIPRSIYTITAIVPRFAPSNPPVTKTANV